MLKLDQKTICLMIRDGLKRIFQDYTIKWNKEYTHVQLFTTCKLRKIKLSEKIMQIFDGFDCMIYRPFHNEFNRFVIINNNYYGDIEIKEPAKPVNNRWIYNIYIMVPDSKIKYEWWYEQFLASI